MNYDRTPCPQRAGGLPCVRSFTDSICVTCRRDLSLTHPTSIEQAGELFGTPPPPPPASVTCPQCRFEGARESSVVPGMSCPACGAVFRVVTPRPEVVAAARRIRNAQHADAERAAGIDSSRQRPLVARLDGLQAQLAVHHSLPLRVIEDVLDEVEPMLDLLARVRDIIDASVARQTAMAAIDGWAEVRDALYPDTDVARRLNERRRMAPAERAAEREAANAAEREAWAGVREHEDDHVTSEQPLVESPPLDLDAMNRGRAAVGMPPLTQAQLDERVASLPAPGAVTVRRPMGVGFLECNGCAQPFPAADGFKLRERGKLFQFLPGVFCPDCAAKYDRGELVRPT